MKIHSKKLISNNSGFTLVELAIVIVIIGLVASGVLGAQSLIYSAKIQSQIKQFTSLEQSTMAFKLEYDYLPGDIPQADIDSYGFVSGHSSSDIDVHNGNKRLNDTSPNCSQFGDHTNYEFCLRFLNKEAVTFFKHIEQAEIAQFGLRDSSYSTVIEGLTVPYMAFDKNFGIIAVTDKKGSLFFATGIKYDGSTWNSSVQNSTLTPSLSVKDIKNIDKKMDNDMPVTGKIISYATPANGNNSFRYNKDIDECVEFEGDKYLYDLSQSGLVCRLMYQTQI